MNNVRNYLQLVIFILFLYGILLGVNAREVSRVKTHQLRNEEQSESDSKQQVGLDALYAFKTKDYAQIMYAKRRRRRDTGFSNPFKRLQPNGLQSNFADTRTLPSTRPMMNGQNRKNRKFGSRPSGNQAYKPKAQYRAPGRMRNRQKYQDSQDMSDSDESVYQPRRQYGSNRPMFQNRPMYQNQNTHDQYQQEYIVTHNMNAPMNPVIPQQQQQAGGDFLKNPDGSLKLNRLLALGSGLLSAAYLMGKGNENANGWQNNNGQQNMNNNNIDPLHIEQLQKLQILQALQHRQSQYQQLQQLRLLQLYGG